jgi:hypothetical protein
MHFLAGDKGDMQLARASHRIPTLHDQITWVLFRYPPCSAERTCILIHKYDSLHFYW